tara:strand:- start:449 stop:1045 length:597 start_codon:yes stop_codon:yes gene_type:complete
MAYGSRQFVKDLALYTAGAAVGAKNSAKFVSYAAKKGIQLAGVGAARAAPVVASTAAANPFVTGTALGLGALATPPGQDLLQAAAARGAADRIAAQQMVDEAIFRSTVLPARQLETAVESPAFRPAVKRKVSKYSKAVKAGMAAVKASKFGGKKGKISNAKSAFKTVNLVASAVNKGKKVSSKGIRGTVARAVKRILK